MHSTIPNERKFEVYHAVETELMSRRRAAERFGISPTRVQQIVHEVKLFVILHGGDTLLTIPAEMLELGALNVCHQRLSFFYSQMMRQWRSDPNDSTSSVRLLNAAARLSIEQAKLTGRIAKVRLAMIEEGTAEDTPQPTALEDEADQPKVGVEQAEIMPAIAEQNAPGIEPAALAPPAGGCTENTPGESDPDYQAMMDALAKNDDVAVCDAITAAMLKRGEEKSRGKTPAQMRPR